MTTPPLTRLCSVYQDGVCVEFCAVQSDDVPRYVARKQVQGGPWCWLDFGADRQRVKAEYQRAAAGVI